MDPMHVHPQQMRRIADLLSAHAVDRQVSLETVSEKGDVEVSWDAASGRYRYRVPVDQHAGLQER